MSNEDIQWIQFTEEMSREEIERMRMTARSMVPYYPQNSDEKEKFIRNLRLLLPKELIEDTNYMNKEDMIKY